MSDGHATGGNYDAPSPAVRVQTVDEYRRVIEELRSQLASLTEENERAWDQLQKATAHIDALDIQVASERARAEELQMRLERLEAGQERREAQEDALQALNAQLDETEGELREAEQRAADAEVNEMEAIRERDSALQRAEALDTKLRAIRTAFLDGRLMDLGEILDKPNPESETDDGR